MQFRRRSSFRFYGQSWLVLAGHWLSLVGAALVLTPNVECVLLAAEPESQTAPTAPSEASRASTGSIADIVLIADIPGAAPIAFRIPDIRLPANGLTPEVLKDSKQTETWLSAAMKSSTGESRVTRAAFLRVDAELSAVQVRNLLSALAAHKLITRLTLAERPGLLAVDPGRQFELNLHKNAEDPNEDRLPPVVVTLKRDSVNGETTIKLGRKDLGTGPSAFEQLNAETLKLIGRPGDPIAAELGFVFVVEDDGVPFSSLRQAIQAVSGRRGMDGKWTPYFRDVTVYGVGTTTKSMLPPGY